MVVKQVEKEYSWYSWWIREGEGGEKGLIFKERECLNEADDDDDEEEEEKEQLKKERKERKGQQRKSSIGDGDGGGGGGCGGSSHWKIVINNGH